MHRYMILFVMSVMAARGAFSSPLIVNDGKPNAQIVIAGQPTRMQKLAAGELQKYVAKITGAQLPVVSTPRGDLPVRIYVGQSTYTDKLGLKNDALDHGAYRMVSGDDYLVLLGRDADFFMEKPGDGGPEYPRSRSDRNRAAKSWTEKNGEKWSTPFMSYFKAYNDKLGLWAQDEHGSLNAVNDFLRTLGVRWYMPGEFGEILPTMKNIEMPEVDRTVRPEWGERQMGFYFNAPFMASVDEFMWQLRLGLNPQGGLGGHGIMYMLQPEKMKKEHPEFYALYGGKRETKSRGGKPCYSSDGLMESALGFARLMFDQYDKDTVSLMPTDGYTYFCQCDLCKGKDSPERGYKGSMSDYIWDFINRAAAEIAETHPEKKISNYAYSTCLLPPEQIERFHPNVAVGICHHRSGFHDPKVRQHWVEIRDAYLKKIPSGKISLWEYYVEVRSGIPAYYPHVIAEDLKSLKGKVNGTMIEVPRGHSSGTDPSPDLWLASNHLNLWLTARLWWNPDRDVDAMLKEYYRNFYGPAARRMKKFIEYCEKNWPVMNSQAEPIEKAFELISKARKAAGEDNIYADRIQLVMDYMEPMKTIHERLKAGRKKNPTAVLTTREAPGLTLDGKLDDPFWEGLPRYTMRELKEGGEVANNTSFQVALSGDDLVFAVRCEDNDMENLTIPAARNGDNLIFSGDSIEILLETASHSYYQIAIDPAGHMSDLDRIGAAVGKKGKINSRWDSGAEVAAARTDGAWTVEVRFSILGANQEELNADYGISGETPTRKSPWYFNVCRVRRRDDRIEMSAFSPTEGSGFHDITKFATLRGE